MTETAQSIGSRIFAGYGQPGQGFALEVAFRDNLDLPPVLPDSLVLTSSASIVKLKIASIPTDASFLPFPDESFALVAARLGRDDKESLEPLVRELLCKVTPEGYLCLSVQIYGSEKRADNVDNAVRTLLADIEKSGGLKAELIEAFAIRHEDDGMLYYYAIAAKGLTHPPLHLRVSGPLSSKEGMNVRGRTTLAAVNESASEIQQAEFVNESERLLADRSALLTELSKATRSRRQAEQQARQLSESFEALAQIYLQTSFERADAIAKAEWLRRFALATLTTPTPYRRFWQKLGNQVRHRVQQSGLFDSSEYLKAYPDVSAAGIDPLLHYVLHGINEGRQPSPPLPLAERVHSEDIQTLLESREFSPIAYEEDYSDVIDSRLSPASHFLTIGKALGRSARALQVQPEIFSQGQPLIRKVRRTFQGFGTFDHDPLVSIIIVSYNSGKDLRALLPSISSQTYRNFEVICIENGTEETEPLLRQHISRYKFQRADNIGFAAANNLAVAMSRGELVALINPDTRLDPEMLQQLVQSMRLDETAAVAVPKINFYEKFISLSIHCDGPFSIATNDLFEGLSYRKHFLRTGRAGADQLYSDETGALELEIPFEAERVARCVLFASAKPIGSCQVKVGRKVDQHTYSDGALTFEIEINFGTSCRAAARLLINNAGSGVGSDGTPFDRGYGEEDNGRYFAKAHVDAMCGCAALIRRAVLIDQNLFISSFFAYFEDSEFSHRLAERGYRILYNPAATVFHRHSESTEESSLLWQVLVSRSRTIYGYATGRTALPLRAYNFNYPAEFIGPLRDKLEQIDKEFVSAGSLDELVRPTRRSACIYNSYFTTMGGGEKHALDLASMLTEYFDVYIVSEKNFSLDKLSKYFNVNLDKVRKIISSNIDPHFTSLFDVFINCTFRSNLVSYAKRSFYVVSFPHRDADLSIIERYTFLHNSKYTQRWGEEYWGEHKSCVLLPVLGQPTSAIERHSLLKKREILSVGRFTPDGHCKNQHLIIAAFRQFVALKPDHRDWRLRLIGSSEPSDVRARNYVAKLKTLAIGLNVSIELNATREVLSDAYKSAAIYVHATGAGLRRDEPELHEHFGIAPFEAMANGCLPVVYAEGGPAEQVEGLAGARIYATVAELAPALAAAVETIAKGAFDQNAAIEHVERLQKANEAQARSLIAELNSALRDEEHR